MPLSSNIFRLVLFAFGLFAFSCEEYRTWELNPDKENRLVVEAILTNELTKQEIRLSQSYQSTDGEAPTVSDAIVIVEANGVFYDFLSDPASPGLYKSKIPFAVFDDLAYHLSIQWEGKEYLAVSELSSVAPMPTFAFSQIPNTDSLTFGGFTQSYNTSQQAMYELEVDWSHLSPHEPSLAKVYYYTFNSVHITQLLLPTKEQVVFPRGSIVYIKKYGLNDDFAAYLRALAIETEWSGNFYYGTSDNLPTNISSGGLGFFSTCAMLRDTVVVR